MKTTNWNQVKTFFRQKHGKFLRRDFLNWLQQNGIHKTYACDVTYRCYLCRAGYLDIVYPGVYIRKKTIPENLTLSQVIKQAYGHKNG